MSCRLPALALTSCVTPGPKPCSAPNLQLMAPPKGFTSQVDPSTVGLGGRVTSVPWSQAHHLGTLSSAFCFR